MDPGCIKVIADKGRSRRYLEQGISVNGVRYDFRYVEPGEDTVPADLVLIAVKYHHLQQAVQDVKNHVGPDTIILSLLNGIASEEIVGGEFGMDKMLYSVCVGIDAVRAGTSIHFSDIGKVFFGEKVNNTYSPKVQAVKNLFDRANIPYVIPEDMLRTLWWKFMVNVGVNQASAVLKAPYGVFHKLKEANDLMEAAMREVISLSQKTGVNLDEADIIEFKKVLQTLSPKGKTSMLQDIEAGRKTEVEMFAGTVTELGRKLQVDTPVNDVLYKIIRALEQMND